jgi:ABC-type transporter Mla MlaB component
LLKPDEEKLLDVLQGARQKLESAGAELVLDFSSVRRLDVAGLRAMQEFATLAQERAVKPALHGVSVELYKVMKLVKLTAAFLFSS